MATSVLHTPSSPGQQGPLLDAEASPYSGHAQSNWDCTTEVNDTHNHNIPAANGMWMGDAPPTSYYDSTTAAFGTPLNVTAWSEYGTAPEGSNMPSPAGTLPSPSFEPDGLLWPMSPTNAAFTNPWTLRDQPLRSPLSEAPSYILAQRLPTDEDGIRTSQPVKPPASGYNSPATTSPSPSAFSQLQNNPKHNVNRPTSSSKRPATPAAGPEPTRLRTFKRYRSDTPPSTTNNTAPSTTNSSTTNTTTTTTTKTTLGGVLPADVDPRVACERIRRQAWERCNAQALEMAQRRTMLRGHEHGALEREMERLRVNLELMKQREREADRRRWEGGDDAGDGGGEMVRMTVE
ncbi:hypothetical protein N657DRAFT_686464 [Parathielavia appendiculata]|uniref:Uncharacterized protein n=1 Tax=Parathielavia appendiculata TaxID=2587402 RepID=A0AAN6U9P7_9PEZI|nr:hypothetical protein N657DRAFT_686464 [Parathielavia appendiculata]